MVTVGLAAQINSVLQPFSDNFNGIGGLNPFI